MGQDPTRFSVRRGGGGRLSLVVVVVVAGLIAGCKTDQAPADDRALDDSPAADVSPTESPTPEAVDDPFAIPDEIDEDYLTLVMQELERIRVEGLRGIYADEELTDENTAYLGAIFTPDEVTRVLRQHERDGVAHGELRARNLTPEPEVPEVEVTRILDDRRSDCLFVEVVMDDTVFLREGVQAAELSYYYRAIVPRQHAADPDNDLNRTPWVIGEAVMHPDRERVDDAEVHSLCA